MRRTIPLTCLIAALTLASGQPTHATATTDPAPTSVDPTTTTVAPTTTTAAPTTTTSPPTTTVAPTTTTTTAPATTTTTTTAPTTTTTRPATTAPAATTTTAAPATTEVTVPETTVPPTTVPEVTVPPTTIPPEEITGNEHSHVDADGSEELGNGGWTFDPATGTSSLEILVGSTQTQLAAAQADYQARIDDIAAARAGVDTARANLAQAVAQQAALQATIEQFTARERAALGEVTDARANLVQHAVAGYVRGPELLAEAFLNGDPNRSAARDTYLQLVAGAELESIDALRDARSDANGRVIELSDQLGEAADEIARATAEVGAATGKLSAAEAAAATAATTVDSLQLRIEVLTANPNRLLFPVAGPAWFTDSWLAPRSENRQHIGVDIIADEGTPLVAIETGTIRRIGYISLGGWRLWIEGDSGTWYYYAHMYGYAPDIVEGARVTLGQQIGWVGRTGNARFSVPHLHLEVHPGGHGAPPVNPYPLVLALAGGNQSVHGDRVGRTPNQITFG